MAQVGRISGPLLTENLERNGVDLAFRDTLDKTQLLYLDVNSGKIGVNTATPTRELEVDGTTQTVNLISDNGLNTPGYEITDSTFRVLLGDIYLNASEAIVMANMENGTIRISDNAISTTISNANIDLTPHGTGTTEIVNDLEVFGSIHTPGNITFEGTITLGDQDTDDVTFNSDITSDIIPDARNTYNLGSQEKTWDVLYTNLINGQVASTGGLVVGAIDMDLREGGILFVAQNGDDAAHGNHYQAPFATISRALQAAEASGDQPFVIVVSPGEYQEALPLVVPPNVSVVGRSLRDCIVTPDTSSQSEDVFHLTNNNTISNLTIKNHYYDSINNTGYAFRFAPSGAITSRSPYIQNVTVLTQETSSGAGDAGRGAWIDGDELDVSTVEKSMLFHSCTFITPNADVINMTNGVRVEWLNSFTYYANRGLYAFNGTSGGAELRSIGSANVYGTYGAVADGADTLMYLIQHNFAYIGAGTDNTNNLDLVVQANEVVELNSGQIHYVSTDQQGNFRVGDNFYVDLETGDTSINIDTGEIDSFSGITIVTDGESTYIGGDHVETGSINIFDNYMVSTVGPLNINSATNTTNIASNTNIDGHVRIVDNLSFGGTLNLAGDQATDRIDFNVNFQQNFNPHRTLVHSLGTAEKQWANVYLDKAQIGDITINDNFITSDVSNADLELRSNGTSEILVPNNDVQIDNNLTVSTDTDLQNTAITGTLTHVGDKVQVGTYTVTNFTLTNDLNIGSQVQLEEILFDGNVVTTTTSNADLELRANGTGQILIPNNTVQINNNLSADNVFNNTNIDITLQTAFGQADINDITITQNYITTTVSNDNLELRASGTGTILVESGTTLNQTLDVAGTTTLRDSVITYDYGPELVTNGTFDTNVSGWTASGGGSITRNPGGWLEVNAIGSAENVSQIISIEPGKTYDFTSTLLSVTQTGTYSFYIRISEPGVGTLLEFNETDITLPLVVAPFTGSFTPTSASTVSIIIRAENCDLEWDNISVVEDIGYVEHITPIDIAIENVTLTGNTTQTGDIDSTGNTTITGDLTVSTDFTSSNFNFTGNLLQNYREDLRLNPANPYDPLSIPQIVREMALNDATEADYAGQTEKNLITFLRNGTTVPYGNSYIDIDSNGTTTSGDALAWLQYVANGTTNDAAKDAFLYNVVELLLEDEFANPGKYNSNWFLGDYFRADMILEANNTGKVSFSTNDVRITNNLSAANIFSYDINIDQDLELNEIIITDSLIEIDDNFISTTSSNSNLELRAVDGIISIPSNNVVIDQDFTVNGSTDIDNIDIQGTITQTGDRNQIGNLNVVGTVTVSTSNIESEVQFDDVLINDNFIETTDSNADLELRANGTGVIHVPSNRVVIAKDMNIGTITSNDINVTNQVYAEEFQASSNVKIWDNVITTTESNSDLELRTVNSSVRLEQFIVRDDIIGTPTGLDIDLSVAGNMYVDATGALHIPRGSSAQRIVKSKSIRYNTDDNVFEAYNANDKIVGFGGVYSSNRLTSVLAHPTNNTIALNILNNEVGYVDSTGLTIHGLDVDDIYAQGSTIGTNVSNSDLDLRANGTGKLILDDITITENKIQNTTASDALIIKHTGYGKVKFNTNTAFRLPAGTTAEQPSSPEVGTTRWNTDEEILETWDGNTFVTAAGSSATISAAEMDDLILEYTLIFG